MKDDTCNRREFLRTATVIASAAAMAGCATVPATTRARAVGANERIRIGIIGCGSRGTGAHMPGVNKFAKEMNLEIVAVCDPWRVAREKAAALCKEWYGREAKMFVSCRDLLAMKDVDAVMIASPDHHHTTHLEAAARAGKHIYVEKPMATEMDRLVRAVDAVRESGVIVQVGTQIRSLPSIEGCRKLVQSGLFGRVNRVEECRNAEKPYWYSYIKKDVKAEDVDWREFLGDRPVRPFDPVVFSGWYGHYEFSQGPVPGLGSHFIDLVHHITGAKLPDTCVCLGGTYCWKDEHRFTAPDQCQALWTYPDGFLVSYSTNFGNGAGNLKRLYGEKGQLKFDNWSAPVFNAEGGPKRDGGIRGENPVPPVERPDHFLDWLQCMREGRTPHAPIEAGYQHAVAVLMAMKSYETGMRMKYDAARRAIVAA